MLIDHYVPRYDFTEVQELPLDPLELLQLAGNDAVRPLAHEVRHKLERVLQDIERRARAHEAT